MKKEIMKLFQNLFQKDSADDMNHFLNTMFSTKVSTDQIILSDLELTG